MKNLLLGLGVAGLGFFIYNELKKPTARAQTYGLFPTTLRTSEDIFNSGGSIIESGATQFVDNPFLMEPKPTDIIIPTEGPDAMMRKKYQYGEIL